MGFAIKQIQSIKPSYAKKLEECQILTTADLLKKCAKKESREKVSKKSGISDIILSDWAVMSDFMRIKGIGEEYSDLLEESGVKDAADLQKADPVKLIESMKETNERLKLARFVPPEIVILNWIDQAKKLKPTEFTF